MFGSSSTTSTRGVMGPRSHPGGPQAGGFLETSCGSRAGTAASGDHEVSSQCSAALATIVRPCHPPGRPARPHDKEHLMPALRTTVLAVALGIATLGAGALVATTATAAPATVVAVEQLAADDSTTASRHGIRRFCGNEGPRLVEGPHRHPAHLPAAPGHHPAGRRPRRRRAHGPARQGRGRRDDVRRQAALPEGPRLLGWPHHRAAGLHQGCRGEPPVGSPHQGAA